MKIKIRLIGQGTDGNSKLFMNVIYQGYRWYVTFKKEQPQKIESMGKTKRGQIGKSSLIRDLGLAAQIKILADEVLAAWEKSRLEAEAEAAAKLEADRKAASDAYGRQIQAELMSDFFAEKRFLNRNR